MKKKVAILLVLVLTLCCVLIACNNTEKEIRISTTTSVNDSKLLAFLQPIFEKESGYKLKIASAGTGTAINSAKMGNSDLILVHSKAQEEDFIKAGYARKVEGFENERLSFMYNYFVIAGDKDDPLKLRGIIKASESFKIIMDNNAKFISRGDASGTHSAELKIWKNILGNDNKPSFDNYIVANKGMGECISMANEVKGYVLTDKATYLAFKNNQEKDKIPNLDILLEQSDEMKNTYSIIAVNDQANFVNDSNIKIDGLKFNTKGADAFIKWMLKPSTYQLINEFGKEQYKNQLFYTMDI